MKRGGGWEGDGLYKGQNNIGLECRRRQLICRKAFDRSHICFLKGNNFHTSDIIMCYSN